MSLLLLEFNPFTEIKTDELIASMKIRQGTCFQKGINFY